MSGKTRFIDRSYPFLLLRDGRPEAGEDLAQREAGVPVELGRLVPRHGGHGREDEGKLDVGAPRSVPSPCSSSRHSSHYYFEFDTYHISHLSTNSSLPTQTRPWASLSSEDLTCYFALQLPPTERESLFRSSALRVSPDVDFGLDVSE